MSIHIKDIKYVILWVNLFLMPINMSANILLNDTDTLSLPLPLPYNGVEYSPEQVNGFIDETIEQSKQPILIFGGNWCPDCRILEGTLQLPTIKKYMNNFSGYDTSFVVGNRKAKANLM